MLRFLISRFSVVFTILVCSIAIIACQSSTIATSPNPQIDSTAKIHTCRSEVAIYNERPVFNVEFDFEDSQFQHLPVAIKHHEENRDNPKFKIWDALYGKEDNEDYWTTPILREYSLEKTDPLTISRVSSRTHRYNSTAEKLNATLSVIFRRKKFLVTCTLKTSEIKSSQISRIPQSHKPTIAEFYTCRAQVLSGSKPLFDVEFDYLTYISIQNLYPEIEEPLYVKIKRHFSKSTGYIQYLEAFIGDDGDYSFWTTPVIRDVAGGRFPIVIEREPGIIGVPNNEDIREQQLNTALSINFARKTYSVKCFQS
jgi:hypothetical protein